MVREVTATSPSLPRLGAQRSPQGSRVLMSLAIRREGEKDLHEGEEATRLFSQPDFASN